MPSDQAVRNKVKRNLKQLVDQTNKQEIAKMIIGYVWETLEPRRHLPGFSGN